MYQNASLIIWYLPCNAHAVYLKLTAIYKNSYWSHNPLDYLNLCMYQSISTRTGINNRKVAGRALNSNKMNNTN